MILNIRRIQNICYSGLMALGVLGGSAAAQTNSPAVPTGAGHDAGRMSARTNALTLRISADYSAVASRGMSYQGASGHSGAQSANASISAAFPLNERWFLPFGLASRNLFLGTVAGVPIPDQIDTLGFDAGLGYHFNDQWTFVGGLGPRFYRLDAIDHSNLGIAGMVRATYRWKPNLTLTLGLAIETDRDVPVLPAAGLRWEIRTNLTLSLMFPKSGLDYRVTPKLNLFVGANGNFTVFRAPNNLGDKIGRLQFNHGLGTYRDFRLGVGAEYQILRGLSAALEGGYSLGREIDYPRIDETVKFGSAPYLQVGLRWRL